MLVKKAYKFRIYPNREQRTLIAKTIGCARFVFNHFLGKWNEAYKETGKGLDKSDRHSNIHEFRVYCNKRVSLCTCHSSFVCVPVARVKI